MIDLIQPATALRAHLGSLQLSAEEASIEGPSPRLLHRSIGTQLWRAPSGEYRIWVSSDEPRQGLGAFKLQVAGAVPKTKDECDSELEIEPDPLVCPPTGALWSGERERSIPVKDENDSELEIEPDPVIGPPTAGIWSEERARRIPTKDENDSELEIEPDPIRAGALATPSDLAALTSGLSDSLAELCAQPEAADFLAEEPTATSRFACAQPIALGGKRDFQATSLEASGTSTYRFQVRKFQHLRIKVRNPMGEGSNHLAGPLAIELFDRHGQRLAEATEELGPLVELGASLVPGDYFLRLHGDEARRQLVHVTTIEP